MLSTYLSKNELRFQTMGPAGRRKKFRWWCNQPADVYITSDVWRDWQRGWITFSAGSCCDRKYSSFTSCTRWKSSTLNKQTTKTYVKREGKAGQYRESKWERVCVYVCLHTLPVTTYVNGPRQNCFSSQCLSPLSLLNNTTGSISPSLIQYSNQFGAQNSTIALQTFPQSGVEKPLRSIC